MLQAADTVYEDSANLQRTSQSRAYAAKLRIQLKRGEQLGSQTPDEIALLVAIDAKIGTENALIPLRKFQSNQTSKLTLKRDQPNAHRVEYLLIGGFAVALHGYPRATL